MPKITPVDAQLFRTAFLRYRQTNTRRAYSADLEAFGRWAAARDEEIENVHEALADLLNQNADKAIDLVEKYKACMAGVKAHTFRRRISTLRTFCAYVHARGRIPWRLAVDSHVARTDEQAEQASAKNMSGPPEEKIRELRRLLLAERTAEALRNLAIVDLTYYRSLRRAELARLDIRHVTPATRTIRIRGKGAKAFEDLKVTPTTLNSIRQWLAVRPGEPKGPLFIRLDRGATAKRAGHRLTENAIYLLLARLGKRVGCTIRPHGLRHTAITEAIVQAAKNRTPLTSVQRFARHKSFNTTAGYVNAIASDVDEVMDSLQT